VTCVTTILLPPVIQQFSRSIKRAKKTQKCTKSFLMDIMEAKSTNSLSKNNIITLSSLLLGVTKIDDRRNSKCRFCHRRKVFERFIRLIQGLNLPRGSMKAMDGAEQSRRGSMEAICVGSQHVCSHSDLSPEGLRPADCAKYPATVTFIAHGSLTLLYSHIC